MKTTRVYDHKILFGEKDLLQNCPTLLIRMLGKKITALIDTGSPFSFVELIEANNLPTTSCWVPLKFLFGSYVCEESITLSVSYDSGVLLHSFYVVPVPGNVQAVLLGRDFIVAAGIKLTQQSGKLPLMSKSVPANQKLC